MNDSSVIGSWVWSWAFRIFNSCLNWIYNIFVSSGMWTYYVIVFFFVQIFVFFLLRLRPAAIYGVDGLLNGRSRARKEARLARLERLERFSKRK